MNYNALGERANVGPKVKLASIPVTPFRLFAVLDKLLNFLRLGRLFHKIDTQKLKGTACKEVSECLTIQTNTQQIIAM